MGDIRPSCIADTNALDSEPRFSTISQRGRGPRQERVRGRSGMNTKHIGALLALGLLITAAPVFAHHGNSNFDIDKKLTLKATVTDWVWANPHCWLKFEATDDKGTVVHWIAET